MNIRRSLWCVLVLLASLHASPRIDLNSQWFFRTDPAKTGEQQNWFRALPSELEPVTLPHTWNVGKHHDFIGTAWYFKNFDNDSSWREQHVEVHFGATFYKSHIWLNGKSVCEHEGGYSEYHCDITAYLQESNFLAVEINNEPKVDTIPGADRKVGPTGTIADWWPDGGIVRGAWLTVNRRAVIRWQHIDSRPSGTSADVSDRIQFENVSGGQQSFKVRVAVFPADGFQPVATVEKDIPASPGSQSVDVKLHFDSAKLWGIDTPFLYRSEASVFDKDGHVLDRISDNFGVRTVEIRDRHLHLNGERVRLTGLTRHEGSPWEGLAETRGTMQHDWDDMKNLQTTLTRPVHYQQDPYIYDYADRNGILMIPEIPMWQFSESQMTNPKVLALAKQLLHELIEQNYNHPAIFAWSMENESATDTPGGNQYFKTMYAYAKQLDPGRYVSFADDVIASVDPAANASRFADFIMWNEYFGSWDGPESLLPGAFEKIAKGYPDKMVLVTEFGYPGVFATDEATADKMRARIIRKQMALFAQQDWIGGAILWCYADYQSSHNLRPGQTDQYVDHGIVDKNRQRRPSYFVWQQENAPAHMQLNWRYDAKGVPTGFDATIARRSEQEIPSYPLRDYRVEWRVVDSVGAKIAADQKTLLPMGPAQTVGGNWGEVKSPMLRVELSLYRPTGFLALRKTLTWRTPQEGAVTPSEVEEGLPNHP